MHVDCRLSRGQTEKFQRCACRKRGSYICGVCNGIVRGSEYTALNGGMISVNNGLERMWTKAVVT
jgi:hypothetical protein